MEPDKPMEPAASVEPGKAGGPEKPEKIYCPACNHAVHLVTTPAHRDGQANLPPEAELVCLDFGKGCSGGRCPLTGVLGIVMGVRLARSGLKEGRWRTVTALCESCGQVSEQKVLDPQYALCILCGATHRWVMLEVNKDARVAVTLP